MSLTPHDIGLLAIHMQHCRNAVENWMLEQARELRPVSAHLAPDWRTYKIACENFNAALDEYVGFDEHVRREDA